MELTCSPPPSLVIHERARPRYAPRSCIPMHSNWRCAMRSCGFACSLQQSAETGERTISRLGRLWYDLRVFRHLNWPSLLLQRVLEPGDGARPCMLYGLLCDDLHSCLHGFLPQGELHELLLHADWQWHLGDDLCHLVDCHHGVGNAGLHVLFMFKALRRTSAPSELQVAV